MEVHIGNRIADISLNNKEGNKVSVTIDGERMDLDITMAENKTCSIIYKGKSFNAEMLRKKGSKNYTVNTNFKTFNIDLIDSQAKYLRMKKNISDKQENNIISPMPGKVIKIPIKTGDRLKEGDTVIVIEAMKMQSNYKVSSDCIIKEILVKEGDSVSGNQVLITLELIKKEE